MIRPNIDEKIIACKKYLQKKGGGCNINNKATLVPGRLLGNCTTIKNIRRNYKKNIIVDEEKTKLFYPSIIIRKEEGNGGIITYKNGKYDWNHQAD